MVDKMNYLAHLYLAGDDDDWIAGALLGDFVKGRLENIALPAGVIEGIRLHRAIDSFTDQHSTVSRSRARLSQRRLVSGIIVDLAYDHFLALRWSQFAAEPLPLFCDRHYSCLMARKHSFPKKLRTMLPHMVHHDWLGSYAELDNVALALERIGTRLSRPDLLTGVMRDLEQHYLGLEQDFLEFFPEAIEEFAPPLAFSQSQPKIGNEEESMKKRPPATHPEQRRMMPGDQAHPGTPGTGENICRHCRGSGRLGKQDCPECGGTGLITEGIGGA